MAYEVENDHECPHCPPTEMQGHHDMHAGMDAEMPCADGLSDCSLDPDFNHDGRGGQTQLKDVKGDGPVIAVSMDLFAPFDKVVRERSPPRFETTHSGAPPALHILYCVYLD